MNYNIGDKVFNDWVITRLIGEGSYGRVMEIEKKEFGLNVKSALKVITIPQSQSEVKMVSNEGLDSKSVTSYFYGFVEEIIKEIATMSELKGQTNIVSYEDHSVIPHKDQIGWDILIRMELLTPLNEYIAGNEITEKTVVDIGKDITTALELCQRKNIIHRDIKPENIFISPDGNFKLGDFGIAKTVDKTTTIMSQKGTYNYMAPEVYLGKQSSHMVDLYSLGLVMYRLLNYNRMPFFPEYPKPITYQNREEALKKRLNNERIPEPKCGCRQLKDIVLKMIAFDPDERYCDITELKREFGKVQTDKNTVINIVQKQDIYVQPEPEDRTVCLFNSEISKKTKELEKETNSAEVETEQGEVEALLSELEKKQGSPKKANVKVFFGAVTGMIAIMIIAIYIFANRKTEVPNFTGMTIEEAQESAVENKLELSTTQEYSDTVEEGKVVSQDIESGTEVKIKKTIQVVVSKGIEMIEVPGFTGISLKEAEQRAEDVGLKLNISEEYSDDVDEGTVISQEEVEGSGIPKGESVNILVSIGKKVHVVPKFVGLTINQAIIQCSELGLTATTLQEYSDTVEEDVVMEQSLEEGTETEEGAQIFFIVSMGKEASQSIGNYGTNGGGGSVSSVEPPNESSPVVADTPAESEPPTEPAEEGFTTGEVEWQE